MATNDEVIGLIRSWIKEKELCAMEMKKLADELETHTRNCTISKCVGSTVAVAGLIGAGVATLTTGGIAAPAIAAATGGVGVSFGVNIVESMLSSETMEKVKKAEKKSDEIKKKIQKQADQLRVKVPSFTRRNSNHLLINFASHDASPQDMNSRQLNPDVNAAIVAISTIFTLQSGYLSVGSLHDIEKLIGSIAAVILGTSMTRSFMVVAGSLALAFMLPEAIRDWKRLIENNHTTEASQSVRKKADIILKICQTLKDQFSFL